MSGIDGRHIRYQIPIPDLFYLQIAIRDPRVASARNRSSHPMLSLATRTEPHGLSGTGIELNAVHSRLNATHVGTVIRPAAENGEASCREKGAQYEILSVGAVQLKKNK